MTRRKILETMAVLALGGLYGLLEAEAMYQPYDRLLLREVIAREGRLVPLPAGSAGRALEAVALGVRFQSPTPTRGLLFIPENVEMLKERCFSHSSLPYIAFGSGSKLMKIERDAFSHSSIRAIASPRA
ncbi:MAG: leucine-rich repeat domain-containing protein [Holosporales bacterium]|nr:leucine-rich repeat domain-containing protein [Holosporales bacterium]